MAAKGILSPPAINRDVTEPLQVLQDFCGHAEFWLKDQNVSNADQHYKIVHLIAPKGFKYGNNSDVITMVMTRNPIKVFEWLQASFQAPTPSGPTKKRPLT